MALDLSKYIGSYRDFPKQGIVFKDFLPIVRNGKVFRLTINKIAKFAQERHADLIAGPESRAFLIGTPVAYKLGIGFVPARKKGKLPTATVSASYGLEYGKSTLYMEKESIKPGQRVIVVDDLIATGGTAKATIDLVKQLGGQVVGAAFVIELTGLQGRKKIENDVNSNDILSLVMYS